MDASRYLATIIECSDDAIIGKTLDGRVISWNKAAERIFGYSADEMIGRPIASLFPQDRLQEEDIILNSLRRGERIEHFETVRLCKDGSAIDVSVTISPIRDQNGEIIGASKIVRDISERKAARRHIERLQSELAHASRVSDMGLMASALAHELNQPLTAIMNYLSAVELDLVGGKQRSTRDIVQKAAMQANRACEIIVRLRDFVQKKQTHHTEESVNKLIGETLEFVLVGSMGSNAKVQTDLTPDLPPVLADKIQVQQVLINLIRNGIEAMQDMPERELTLISTEGNKGYARVSVLDTGPGIQKEIADRLFQSFVTSKAKGLGIGLTISKTIIEAHGGRIWAVPNSRGGAAFHFELPFAENRPG